jgi:hypothetical protein
MHALASRAGDDHNFSVNSPNNMVTLGGALGCYGLDAAHFVFYPFKEKWALLWVGKGSFQTARKHNFREVDLPKRVRAMYLFARFAWNVFILAEKCFEGTTNMQWVEESNIKYAPGNGNNRRNRGQGGPLHREGKNAKKRVREPQVVQKTKKRRLAAAGGDAAIDDIPDISPITPKSIRIMERMDRLLQAGKLPYNEDSDWYPGYSRVAQLAYDYKQSHPAATDPGGARTALVSERQE